MRSWRGAASVLVYAVATAVMGRQVLAHLSTHVANDLGDPLLTAAILHWNASHLPWTDAWYQLPFFYPTRDVMTFSEHLLGLSLLAAPIQWLTGSPLVTYNITMLLTFVLSAAAMYALVRRLTGSAGAAFVAGVAFGFAPYRMSQLPHIQMLAAFYAPLAVLGLHAYVDTGRRRWLFLYSAAWLLQAAANGYMLVFFSVFVGLWVLWFVIAARQWRTLLWIGAASAAALLPLVPILLRYIRVHQFHGFARSVAEIRSFSPDMLALFCAPSNLTVWGWLRLSCRPEGELFPGIVLPILTVIAAVGLLHWRSRSDTPRARVLHHVSGLLAVLGLVYLAIAASVWVIGPWRLSTVVRASASSIGRPLVVGSLALLAATLLRTATRDAIRRQSTLAFYLLAAIAMWALALGPSPHFGDMPIEYDGPFAWLMLLPGGDSLRVPARFWLMCTFCLAVVAGFVTARLLAGTRRRVGLAAVAALGMVLLADGWTTIPALAVDSEIPGRQQLAGRTVLALPSENGLDIAAEYQAMVGGWTSVNGYSGFVPLHYVVLRDSLEYGIDVLQPLQARGDLVVLVARDATAYQQLLRQQPGVRIVAENARRIHFLLPARPARSRAGATRIPIASVRSNCDRSALGRALDRDASTHWVCGPTDREEAVIADLGTVRPAGAVVHASLAGVADYPRALRIDTSMDGVSWTPAWSGTTWGAAFDAALADPSRLRLVLAFEPRDARYVRVSHPGHGGDYTWSVAELEVWSR